MTATAIRLPRASTQHDVVDTLESFHEAIRAVAAWAPTIIDDNGTASPRDARWLRAFLTGPLAWHLADEENLVVPRLSLRQSDWLDACLARSAGRRALIAEQAAELAALLEPLCAGESVPVLRFKNAARRFERVVEDALRFEDDIMLPSARTFLDPAERESIAKEIMASDETRRWLDVAAAGDVPTIHRVHAVRTRTAGGLEIVRSFADCPRRRAVGVEACAGCPHQEEIHIGEDGTGHVGCAIDDAPVRSGCVGAIMTRDVVCVERDTPLVEAAELLSTTHVSGMPVVDGDGHPIGVISQTDVVHALAQRMDVNERSVGDVMMHVAFVVRENDSIEDAARLLVIEGIHRLPVINADRTVVGIISTLDVLRATVAQPRGAA